MARNKIGSTLSNLIGSDSEDEFQRKDIDALLTPDSAIENATRGNSLGKASIKASARSNPKTKVTKRSHTCKRE